MTKKTQVLDTSVLVSDPLCYKNLPDSDIIIPIVVLEELDKLKKFPGETGRNARVCIRLMDELSESGDINLGIDVGNNSTLRVDSEFVDEDKLVGLGDPKYGDTRILACALKYASTAHGTKKVVLVSNDFNLKIKARSHGILAQSHKSGLRNLSDLFGGISTVIDKDAGLDLQEDDYLDAPSYDLGHLNENEFVLFVDDEGVDVSHGRKVGDKIKRVDKVAAHNLFPRNPEQAFAINLITDKKIDLITLIGKAGTGKSLVALAAALDLVLNKKTHDRLVIYRPIQAVGKDVGYLPGPQPLDAKILTPRGWTTMGEIKPDMEVISRDGKATKVLGVFPKGTKSVYKVTTTEGTSTECCEDHLWETRSYEDKKRGRKGSVKSTKQIMESMKSSQGKINHYLPRNEAIEFGDIGPLPIPAYTLGALIGDGSFSNAISLANTDQDIVDRVNKELKKLGQQTISNSKTIHHNITNVISYNNKPAKPIEITNLSTNERIIYNSIGLALQELPIKRGNLHYRCMGEKIVAGIQYKFLPKTNRWTNVIKNELESLGLMNKKAWDKFIPVQYKLASVSDRIALLQGLMDTDGTIKKNGEASFTTTSKVLAEDITELVRSLGGRSVIKERNRIGKRGAFIGGREIVSRRISYEFNISLPESINPFYCVRKASRHSCKYMHHTGITNIEYVGEKEVQCIRVENPEHLYITDNFIVTHNTLEEKLGPWMQPIMDNLEVLFTKGKKSRDNWKREVENLQRPGHEKIEMEAITYVRGRSIPNSIILIDEAQNLSHDEIKTILTRAGEGTKIIITGDIEQIDNDDLDATNNGLTYVIEKFKTEPMAGHVTLTKGERSALASKAAEIL